MNWFFKGNKGNAKKLDREAIIMVIVPILGYGSYSHRIENFFSPF